MKVLIVAPYCDGQDVGEAWSAHQWVSQLSALHEVTLLTLRRRGRKPPSEQLNNCRVIEWDDLPLPAGWERVGAMVKPGYPWYAWRVKRWIASAKARGEAFDVAHQLTPIALRYPSPLATSGIPYLLGPLAGSAEAHPSFDTELGGSAWYVRLRRLDRLRLAHDPLLRSSLRKAAVVIGVAPYVEQLLRSSGIQRFVCASETGVESLPPPRCRIERSRGVLDLLYAGRVVRTKGVVFAVRALGQLKDLPGVRLTVVGDGDDLQRCRAEAQHLGLAERIVFTGRLPRTELEKHYENAHAFLFPSLREPSGNVVLESMRHSLPIVACDNGGPAHVIENEVSGLLVPARSPESYVMELALRVRRLALDPQFAQRLGVGARQRMQSTALWPMKAAWVSELYSQVAQHETPNPSQADSPGQMTRRTALAS